MPVPDQFETFEDGAVGFSTGNADENIMGFGTCSGGTAVANTPYWFRSPDVARDVLGKGVGLEWVLTMLAGGRGKPVGFTKVAGSVPGTHSAVTQVGSGPVMTLGGTPVDDEDLAQVQIRKAGALGVGTFRYSLDGGVNWSPDLVLSATYDTGEGTILTFAAGSYVLGTTYSFTGIAPGYLLADLVAAYSAADLSATDWELGFPIGHVTYDTSDAVTDAAHLAIVTGMAVKTTASEAAHRFRTLIFEGPDTSDTTAGDGALNTAFLSYADMRTLSAAYFVKVTSPRTGRKIRRSAAWAAAYRARQVPPKRDLAAVADKALPSFFSIEGEHDEAARQGLDRFITLRTITGKAGVFISNAPILSAGGSDYRWLQHRRLIDRAARITREKALDYLSDEVPTYSGTPGGPATEDPSRVAGTILESAALDIEGDINAHLYTEMTAKREVQFVKVEIDRSEVIETSEDLKYATRLKAFTYPKTIHNRLGFAP